MCQAQRTGGLPENQNPIEPSARIDNLIQLHIWPGDEAEAMYFGLLSQKQELREQAEDELIAEEKEDYLETKHEISGIEDMMADVFMSVNGIAQAYMNAASCPSAIPYVIEQQQKKLAELEEKFRKLKP